MFSCVCRVCTQLYVILCDPMGCNSPGSSVLGISQARILEWVAISSSGGSSQLRDGARISYIACVAGGFLTTSAIREALFLCILYTSNYIFEVFKVYIAFIVGKLKSFLNEVIYFHIKSINQVRNCLKHGLSKKTKRRVFGSPEKLFS